MKSDPLGVYRTKLGERMTEEYIYSDTYLLDRAGYVSVRKIIQCQSCLAVGEAFIRLDTVVNDYLTSDTCPNCHEALLKVISIEHVKRDLGITDEESERRDNAHEA